MKVFISWSGPKSHSIALSLRGWLPRVLQALEPWLASRDIGKGARWHAELERHLSSTRVAILCVTKDNLLSPWIAFEAGALSRELDRVHVCPYLVGATPNDLSEPLRQFQVTLAEKEDTRKLLHTLNRALKSKAVPEPILNDVFEERWPELWQKIQAIRSEPEHETVDLEKVMSFGTRHDEPVEVALARVQTELLISGNDCKKLVEAKSADIEALLRKGVRIRVICVDPKSQAPSMLAKVDPRFSTATEFKRSMESIRGILKTFTKRYKSLFEYRLLPILPAFGLFLSDPDALDGVVRVELYTSKPWSPIPLRPRLLLPTVASEWRQYFREQWNNYWALSRVDG